MARFKDVLPSQQGWIHELARAEIHPDAEKLLQLGGRFDPQQLVEESTIDFLMELRERFTEFARVFNGYSESNSRFQDVKIYSLAQTPADFMLYRNHVKLVVSNHAHGLIQLAFAQHLRGTLAVDGQIQEAQPQSSTKDLSQPNELIAQVGPFQDVFWTFQGEKVTAEQVAKFYFSEFVRSTRDFKHSKSNNQLLLEQNNSLLKEKGLNI